MLLCCYELRQYINRFIRRLARNEAADNNLDYSPLTDTITEDD
jgi:hypothetical protein